MLSVGAAGCHQPRATQKTRADAEHVLTNTQQRAQPNARPALRARAQNRQLLLRPAAEALNAAVNHDTAVEFTLTGEQGLSVFSHPRSWMALLDSTKAVTSR